MYRDSCGHTLNHLVQVILVVTVIVLLRNPLCAKDTSALSLGIAAAMGSAILLPAVACQSSLQAIPIGASRSTGAGATNTNPELTAVAFVRVLAAATFGAALTAAYSRIPPTHASAAPATVPSPLSRRVFERTAAGPTSSQCYLLAGQPS
jgi:hypothetical protein